MTRAILKETLTRRPEARGAVSRSTRRVAAPQRPQGHRPNVREVAEMAGVAISSVSRVLSKHPDVSPAMRRRSAGRREGGKAVIARILTVGKGVEGDCRTAQGAVKDFVAFLGGAKTGLSRSAKDATSIVN